MARRTLDEMISAANAIFGENNSDDVLTFLEDLSDTLAERETGDGVDWRAEYEKNDAEWRHRYRERFSGKQETVETIPKEEVVEEESELTIDDLFTAKEEK